jgi:hypothetical protein
MGGYEAHGRSSVGNTVLHTRTHPQFDSGTMHSNIQDVQALHGYHRFTHPVVLVSTRTVMFNWHDLVVQEQVGPGPSCELQL